MKGPGRQKYDKEKEGKGWASSVKTSPPREGKPVGTRRSKEKEGLYPCSVPSIRQSVYLSVYRVRQCRTEALPFQSKTGLPCRMMGDNSRRKLRPAILNLPR